MLLLGVKVVYRRRAGVNRVKGDIELVCRYRGLYVISRDVVSRVTAC